MCPGTKECRLTASCLRADAGAVHQGRQGQHRADRARPRARAAAQDGREERGASHEQDHRAHSRAGAAGLQGGRGAAAGAAGRDQPPPARE
eukprot:scaffold27212_cov59-Phaeocystis_antarctica.AAC.10